jgi:hypothetical protein
MFPVRWSQDLGYGYGYPIFNFYNPFPYYIGGFLEISLNDALFATKLLFILAIVISGFSAYLLSKEFFKKAGGIITAVFYVYAPYHAVDVYVRGALAEAFAYAFTPLLFYGAYKIYKKQNFFNVLLFSISLALVICSHNLTALIVMPFVLIFMVYLIYLASDKSKLSRYLFLSLGFGLVLSAFYFIPAVLEMDYTNVVSQIGAGADFRDHFVCLSQLWTSQWGYGGSVKGCNDGLSFMIGKYHIILVFFISLAVLGSFTSKKLAEIFKKQKETFKFIVLFLMFFIFSSFMTLPLSKPIWEAFIPLSYVQYPWRFLSLILLFASFIIGATPILIRPFIKERTVYFFVCLISIFLIAASIKFFTPQSYLKVTSQDYLNEYSVKWITSKISDEYMPKNFQKPTSFYEIPDPNNLSTKGIFAKFIIKKTQKIELNINVSQPGRYIFPIAYFPSWKAFLDGNNTPIIEANRGIVVNLPKGEHKLKFEFIQTPIEFISSLISFAGILCGIAGIIILKFKKI